MFNLKNILILLIIGIVAVGTVVGLRLLSGEDDWICVNGEWKKHGNPSAPKPETGCGEQDDQGLIKSYEGEISETFQNSVKIKTNQEDEIVVLVSEGTKVLKVDGKNFDLSYLRRGLKVKVVGYGAKNNIIAREIEILADPDVIVYTPKANEEVDSPVEITGEAKGYWFFEGVFPAVLVDSSDKEIASGQMKTEGEWMTENYVSFKGEIKYSASATTSAKLVLKKDNPSGLPTNEAKVEIPITLKPNSMMKVRAYFNNDQLDPEVSCNKVFPVEREIIKTQAVARAALEELLKGASEEEKSDGYFTNINSGVIIQKLTIENGIVKADFSKRLEEAVGGSCRVIAIRSQITETLKQFSNVKNVIISIDSRTEDILQP